VKYEALQVQAIDEEEWRREILMQDELFMKLHARLPKELIFQRELLLALEQVTMETLKFGSDEHSRLSFDANDYRMLRIEELRLSAQTAAEKVIRTGTPFRFNPMNSRERRVIHLALRGETAVRSESAGSGPGRQVVVYPAGMASLPEVPYVPAPRREAMGDRRGAPGDRRGGPRGRR